MLLLVVLLTAPICSAVSEPKTGVKLPDRYKGAALESLGVRSKGPIKVYSVGKYGSTFYLKMLMKVGGEKMSSSLSAALTPRGCSTLVTEEFESLLLSGLPNGASKGTSFAFGTGKGKLSVFVNDKHLGTIANKQLAKAFAGIYTDSKAVCQLLPIGDKSSVETSPPLITPKKCASIVATIAIGLGLGLVLA